MVGERFDDSQASMEDDCNVVSVRAIRLRLPEGAA